MKLGSISTLLKDSLRLAKRPTSTGSPRSEGNVVAMGEHFAQLLLEGLQKSLTGHANAVETRRLTAAHLVWLSQLDHRAISRLQSLITKDHGRALAQVMSACERQRATIARIRGTSSRRTAPPHRIDPDLDRPVSDHVVGLEEARTMRIR
jgi:hypothetical protein